MIADLVEEKRRCAQDSVQRADYTFMLEAERDKLLQQVSPISPPLLCLDEFLPCAVLEKMQHLGFVLAVI